MVLLGTLRISPYVGKVETEIFSGYADSMQIACQPPMVTQVTETKRYWRSLIIVLKLLEIMHHMLPLLLSVPLAISNNPSYKETWTLQTIQLPPKLERPKLMRRQLPISPTWTGVFSSSLPSRQSTHSRYFIVSKSSSSIQPSLLPDHLSKQEPEYFRKTLMSGLQYLCSP